MTQTLSQMLIQLKNGCYAGLRNIKVTTPAANSKLCRSVLTLLEKEGLISTYTYTNNGDLKASLKIILKQKANSQHVINNITIISKPGRRVYINIQTIWKIKNGFGTYIISTPKGIMTDREARFHNLGGELLCSII